jgi:hypothetical protein
MSNTSDLTQGEVFKLQAELEDWKEAKQEEKAHKKNQTIASVVLSKKKLALYSQEEEAIKKRDDVQNKVTLLENEKYKILTQALLAKVKEIESKLTTTFNEIEDELKGEMIRVKIKYWKNGNNIVEHAGVFLVTQVGETFLFKVTLEDDNLPTYLRKEKKERFEAISSELKSLEDQLRDLCTEISVIGRNIMNFDLVKEKITAQIDYNTLDEEDKQLVAELEKSLDKSNLFLTTDE